MNISATVWPWLALAGLGAFHGLNPGMGWLFAVALGLHRKQCRIVYLSLLPIAFGHALAIASAALVFVWAGLVFDTKLLRIAGGLLLIGWAIYMWRFGHRHRVRFGMQASVAGLALWSFLMASAHGAGLMLWPVLLPLCQVETFAAAPAPALTALAGVGVHTLAMLAVTGLIAAAVYEWVGLELLRRAWFNVDLIWLAALLFNGGLLLATAL